MAQKFKVHNEDFLSSVFVSSAIFMINVVINFKVARYSQKIFVSLMVTTKQDPIREKYIT